METAIYKHIRSVDQSVLQSGGGGDCFVLVFFHWNPKMRSPGLSSDKGAVVFLLFSKTEYLRFGLSLILLTVKCWYRAFLAEGTTDGYCKQAYSHFFYWWVTYLLHRSLVPVRAYVWECWLWAILPCSQVDCISLGRFAVQRPLPVWKKNLLMN